MGSSGGAVVLLISLSLVILNCVEIASGQRVPPPPNNGVKRVMCGHDTLMIYQDCRLCTCPKGNRPAQCFRKICDVHTKGGGQCPNAILRLDDRKLCSPGINRPTCHSDNDCPGAQLCCHDYCNGSKCADPVPKDQLRPLGQPRRPGGGGGGPVRPRGLNLQQMFGK